MLYFFHRAVRGTPPEYYERRVKMIDYGQIKEAVAFQLRHSMENTFSGKSDPSKLNDAIVDAIVEGIKTYDAMKES